MLSLAVYVGDVAVLSTYFTMTMGWLKVQPFHYANAVFGVPTLAFEISVHAWPVMPLTVTFCLVGWIGVWRTRHESS
jgi:hypothetical protein